MFLDNLTCALMKPHDPVTRFLTHKVIDEVTIEHVNEKMLLEQVS